MEVTVLLGRLCSVSQSSTRKSAGAATAPRLAQKNDPATRLVKTSWRHGHGNFGCVTGKNVTPLAENTTAKRQCPNFGARLCEPQHVVLQIKPLRVTDPRSVFKLGHHRKTGGILTQITHAAKVAAAQGPKILRKRCRQMLRII